MKLRIALIVLFICIVLSAIAQEKQPEEQKQTSTTSSLLQYGALGAMVIAMFWYIVNRDKAHAKERAETNKIIENQFARMNQLADQDAKKSEAYTSILAELKTLIQVDIQKKSG